jgi:Protein of unknown function (DUF4240)
MQVMVPPRTQARQGLKQRALVYHAGRVRADDPMTGLAMTNERFWNLIDQARAGSKKSAFPKLMAKVLGDLSDEEIFEFGHKFYEKLCDLNRWQLWGAGFVINGGMGDDSFHYFRSWIVGKGGGASNSPWVIPTIWHLWSTTARRGELRKIPGSAPGGHRTTRQRASRSRRILSLRIFQSQGPERR